eukprot:gi/632977829/ref/XP_007905565.1/ PREDICTED: rho GTPase-activating protein 27-like [Callorhinchus milii]
MDCYLSSVLYPEVFEEGESLYQNVGILRQELARKPPPPTPPTLEAWETHSDQASGQLFYYNTVSGETTWDSPFQQPDNWEQPAPASPDPSDSVPSDPGIPSDPYEEWESHVDEASGRTYFYHPATGETTWELPSPREEGTPEHMDPSVNLRNQRPPTPEQDYPEIIEEIPEEPWGHRRTPSSWSQDLNSEPESPTGSDIPPGWSCHTDPEGQLLYTSDFTQETWIRHMDDNGQNYYYNPDGGRSEWDLPQITPALSITAGQPSTRNGDGIVQDSSPIFNNWRHTILKPRTPEATEPEEKTFASEHQRNASDYSAELEFGQPVDVLLPHSHMLEKVGILNRAKVLDNGKRIRKNWATSWTVLHGSILTFHKDPKNQSAGSLRQTAGQIVPEHTVDLRGATIGWAARDKSSKKHKK